MYGSQFSTYITKGFAVMRFSVMYMGGQLHSSIIYSYVPSLCNENNPENTSSPSIESVPFLPT